MVIELINECGDKDQDVALKTGHVCESDRSSYHQGVRTAGQEGVDRHCRAGGGISGAVPQGP